MWNVILQGIRATMVAEEKSNEYYTFRVCVCGLSYPTWKAHAPYYFVTCGQSGSTIFFHIIEHKMCVLMTSTILVRHIIILRSIQWDVIINVHWSSCKVIVHSCQILMILEFSSQSFEKILKYKISWIGRRLFHADGQTNAQTDICDEANNPFSLFCERA